MYTRTHRIIHLHRLPRIRRCGFVCMRCLTTNTLTASSRVKHLSQVKSTYDIVKDLKDIYSTANTTFIEDVVATCTANSSEEASLPLNVLRNDTVKEYLLKDCCEIVMKDDMELILNSLGILHRTKILPRYEYRSQDASSLRVEFLQLLMNQNHVALSTVCILNLIDSGIEVPYSTVQLLIGIISSSPYKEFPINAYCLLQLLPVTPRIEPSELFTSLMYLSSNANGNYFANHLFFQYADVTRKMSIRQQHSVILSMLEVNLENSDTIQAIKVFHLAKPIILAKVASTNQTSSYVEKLIKIFQLHHDEALIAKELEDLPECLNTDNMVDYKLSFYARHSPDKFNALVETLRSPLRRSSLTSLLNSFVQLRDETNAEKIMETIFAHSSINSAELQTIVEKLLQQGKISGALSMVRRMKLETTKSSYLTIFKHTWVNKDQQFFKELYLKFMKLKHNDSMLELFTIELIRAISSIDNRQAIRYYVKFLKVVDSNKTNKLYQQIDFKRYGFLDEFSQLIRLSPFGVVECLKVVSRNAIYTQDDISLRWCIEELRKCGWKVRTIIEYLQYFDSNGYLERVLKERAFK